MPARVVQTGFAGLGRVLASAAASARVVGFDVFDTLIRRRVEPEVVKDRVAIELVRRAAPGRDWRLVRERRRVVERALFEERCRSGADGEYHLRELVPRWLDDVGLADQALATALVAWEMELERRAQAATPGIADVLAALAAAGRRLVFVSDMYFGAAEIQAFLDRLGLGAYFATGYASCDHGCRKGTGRLFEHVLAHEGVAPAALLFVGNNRHVDVHPARALGIPAVHVVDRDEHKRRHRLEVAGWASARGPFWRGNLTREVVESIPIRSRPHGSPAYGLGRTVAPAYAAFATHLVETLRRRPVRQVYFLSREGWLFFRLYRRLRTALGLGDALPAGRYLFASRLATFLPSVKRLDWSELTRMWRQYDRQSLRLLLRNLTLPAAEFEPLAVECGIQDLDAPILQPEVDVAFRRFLAHPEVQRRFSAHREEAHGLLRAYLEQIGVFGGGEVAFVDVGWKGSIQANIVRAFEDDRGFPYVRGLYLAKLHEVDLPPRTSVEGFLADSASPDFLAATAFRTVTPFEMTATAVHGSVVGYERPPRRGGRVVPRLVYHDVERRHAPAVREAMAAVHDWFGDFCDCLGLCDTDVDALAAAAVDRLRRYVLYPTRGEARFFAGYAHVESFGVHGVTTFGAVAWLREVLRAPGGARLRAFWERLDAQLWPQLTLRRTPIPFAQFAHDLRTTLRSL